MSGPRRDEPRPHPDLSRLEALIERIRAIKDGLGSEQATREVAVNPIIGELGWDTLNPEEVAREFSVLGGKVDYCLRTPTRDLVLIEVKRAGVDLDEHEKQLLRYAFDEGVPLGALTNGLAWWLYLPRAEGSWTQRRFSRIDLLEQDSASVASVLHRFLNHDGLVNGSALQEAQREFDSQERDRRLRAALHEAWLRMLSDPESLLRAELSETAHEISGHVPDKQMLDEFLADVLGNENVDRELPPVRRRRTAPVVRPARTEPPGASQTSSIHGDEAFSWYSTLRVLAGRKTSRGDELEMDDGSDLRTARQRIGAVVSRACRGYTWAKETRTSAPRQKISAHPSRSPASTSSLKGTSAQTPQHGLRSGPWRRSADPIAGFESNSKERPIPTQDPPDPRRDRAPPRFQAQRRPSRDFDLSPSGSMVTGTKLHDGTKSSTESATGWRGRWAQASLRKWLRCAVGVAFTSARTRTISAVPVKWEARASTWRGTSAQTGAYASLTGC